MSWQLWDSWGEEWELAEKVSFNGFLKRITVNSGVTDIDIGEDVYSAWARWMVREDNSRFPEAIRYAGYDPIPGGYTGTTFFMTRGWKFCYDPSVVAVTGAMYSDNYDTAYWSVDGIKPIYPATVSSLVNSSVSFQNVVTGTALTIEETRQAVWAATNLAAFGINTAGEKLESVGASANPWTADLSSYNIVGTAGKVLKDTLTSAQQTITNTDSLETSLATVQNDLSTIKGYTDTLETSAQQIKDYTDTLETSVSNLRTVVDDIDTQLQDVPTASNIASQVRIELTDEIAHLMTLQNGLTSGQATMLLESYRLLGLDPTKPLVVTKTSRSAGAEIQQSIASDANTSVVTRL